ncbi:MAG TPA: azurin [Gammaproteobacteria bacterium]
MFRNILVALGLLFAAPPAFAAECSAELTGNDAMQFNLDTIEVNRSCREFTINLTHVGKLAKNVMGHNVVISKTEDMNGINNDGMQAGLENGYIKPADTRVIAQSDMIGGGESTSVSFDPMELEEGGAYSFFCSFPGHASLMKGVITVVP